MCFIEQMYKLHACRYIASVYPLLRFAVQSLFLRSFFSLPLVNNTKMLKKKVNVFICIYEELVNSGAKHSKI